MAGIGFALRKLLNDDSYYGTARAYGYAGMISSGPWVLSIVGILILGLLTVSDVRPTLLISQFQVSVTFLIATSLILSGLLQHAFTRFLADELFANNIHMVMPNFHGAMFLTTFVSGLIGFVFVLMLMPVQTWFYKILFVMTFVILCNIWLTTNLLSGLKAYRAILLVFFIGYATTIGLGYYFRNLGLEGLMLGFVIGQWILLLGMMITLYHYYPSDNYISFAFLKKGRMYLSLVAAGFFYNFGVWIDKFLFWYSPSTSHIVIGPLRASVIYDIPIFLAYLSIIPGMAVFLVRIETDFVEYYDKFYRAVREGGKLEVIREHRNEMVVAAKQGIFDIIKIQGLAVLLVFAAGPVILDALSISRLYLPLLSIDVVGVGLQVVFLGILNILFYLDKRRDACILTILFFVFNLIFTFITIQLGAFYFGYGFALALLVVIVLGMYALDNEFEDLEYTTFMLQA